MKKLEVKILENFRRFDEEESGEIRFKTDLACRGCLKVTGNYILIEGWIRICKSCLSEWINMLNKNRMKQIKPGKRN